MNPKTREKIINYIVSNLPDFLAKRWYFPVIVCLHELKTLSDARTYYLNNEDEYKELIQKLKITIKKNHKASKTLQEIFITTDKWDVYKIDNSDNHELYGKKPKLEFFKFEINHMMQDLLSQPFKKPQFNLELDKKIKNKIKNYSRLASKLYTCVEKPRADKIKEYNDEFTLKDKSTMLPHKLILCQIFQDISSSINSIFGKINIQMLKKNAYQINCINPKLLSCLAERNHFPAILYLYQLNILYAKHDFSERYSTQYKKIMNTLKQKIANDYYAFKTLKEIIGAISRWKPTNEENKNTKEKLNTMAREFFLSPEDKPCKYKAEVAIKVVAYIKIAFVLAQCAETIENDSSKLKQFKKYTDKMQRIYHANDFIVCREKLEKIISQNIKIIKKYQSDIYTAFKDTPLLCFLITAYIEHKGNFTHALKALNRIINYKPPKKLEFPLRSYLLF